MVTCSTVENNQMKPHTLTVIDVINRFIVFTTQIEMVSTVIIEFGICYVLTKSKVLYQLDERDLQSKLNSLYKKNMYDMAVKIAKNNQYDADGLSEIFKQYGDHLYTKANFTGAIEQYIKTIGHLEPSYVIRRFLDSRHTQYLTDYLQNIHKIGIASNDHTTLLLNCFTRLDRTVELKLFLENYKQNHFDIDIAINVCRKSCIEQALELAKYNEKHEYVVSMMIEDIKQYENAVNYLMKLSYDKAESNIIKYGNLLMSYVPQKFTELLKKQCTNYIQLKNDKTMKKGNEIFLFGYLNGKEQSTPEIFVHLFNDSKQSIDYIEYLVMNFPSCTNFLYNSLIEHYLELWKYSENPSNERLRLEQYLVKIMDDYRKFYDKNHILAVCKTYEFWIGVMLIYEDQKLYNLIVHHFLGTTNYSNLYTLSKRLSADDPSIWLHSLNCLKSCSNDHIPTLFLQEILQTIANEKMQSPLQILNVLTSFENIPHLSTVRNYFLQIFQKEDELIIKNKITCKIYYEESDKLKKNIEILSKYPIEFRGSLCEACHQPLNLPSLFLLCKHSYHQDCIRSFSESGKDCTVCKKINAVLLDKMHFPNETLKENHVFKSQIDETHEPFAIVAEYFSQGLFNKIVLLSYEGEKQKKIKSKTSVHVDTACSFDAKISMKENAKYIQQSQGRSKIREKDSNKISDKILNNRKINGQEIKIKYPISTNPFDDETYDIDDKMYDDSLNPFSVAGKI